MITCSCNRISTQDLTEAINAMLCEDPWQIIVPNKLFRYLSSQGKCGFCFPNVVKTIVETTELFHRDMMASEATASPETLSLERLEKLQLELKELSRKYDNWLLLARRAGSKYS